MKYCPKCGVSKDDIYSFCDKCGARLAVKPAQESVPVGSAGPAVEGRPASDEPAPNGHADVAGGMPANQRGKRMGIAAICLILAVVLSVSLLPGLFSSSSGGGSSQTAVGVNDAEETEETGLRRLSDEIYSCFQYYKENSLTFAVNDRELLDSQKEKLYQMIDVLSDKLKDYQPERCDPDVSPYFENIGDYFANVKKDLITVKECLYEIEVEPETDNGSMNEKGNLTLAAVKSRNNLNIGCISACNDAVESALKLLLVSQNLLPEEEVFPDLAADPG